MSILLVVYGDMDEGFEQKLLAIVDNALSDEPTAESFRRFELEFQGYYDSTVDKATAHVKHLLGGKSPFEIPDEYTSALDVLLSRERRWAFLDIAEQLPWIVSGEFELTDQDLRDGYRPIEDFFSFLKVWREDYRRSFQE